MLIEPGSLSLQVGRNLAVNQLQCWVAAAAMDMLFSLHKSPYCGF